MTEEIKNITKEAGVLRVCLENGKLDIKETVKFLARVERLNSSPGGKKKREQRFQRQMSKL